MVSCHVVRFQARGYEQHQQWNVPHLLLHKLMVLKKWLVQ